MAFSSLPSIRNKGREKKEQKLIIFYIESLLLSHQIQNCRISNERKPRIKKQQKPQLLSLDRIDIGDIFDYLKCDTQKVTFQQLEIVF